MTSSVISRWGECYDQRHAWAFRAYEKFMAALSPEIREHLAYKTVEDEAYVVVFGRTQVGKTTLVMDLMGVPPSALVRVSKVLRGGRAVGRSSTATATEYRRSPDDRWGLRSERTRKTRWFDNDTEMTQAFADLRQAMQEHRLNLSEPCVVHIPQDCLDSENSSPLARMLDLPGDAPADDVEQAYVQEIARRYVPLADLILLVGRGDDLSFLSPEGLTLPGIEDWQSVPGRFRIVTTYSFTAGSVRDLVRERRGALSPDIFRDRLIEQIEKSCALNPLARRPKNYFPLEFGQSWMDEQRRTDSLYKRISPLIAELKQQLIADIQASTTPLARLRGAVLAHGVVSRVKEMQLAHRDEKLKVLQAQLNRSREDHAQASGVIEDAVTKIESKKKSLAHLAKENLTEDLEQRFKLDGETILGDVENTVGGFELAIMDAKSSLRQRVEASRPLAVRKGEGAAYNDLGESTETRRRFWRKLLVGEHEPEIERILGAAFEPLQVRLKSYWLDKYWFTGSDANYSQDRVLLENSLKAAEEKLLQAARQWWREIAERELGNLLGEQESLQVDLEVWKEDAQRLGDKVDRYAHQYQSEHLDRLRFEQRMDKDLAESKRFNGAMDTAYLEELRRRHRSHTRHESPVFRFINLLGAIQIIDARRELARITDDN